MALTLWEGSVSRQATGINSARVKKAEGFLLKLIRQHGPQGRNIDLPDTTKHPEKKYLAVAAQRLVDRFPSELTIQRFQDRLVLVWRRYTDAVISSETRQALENTGFTAKKGDDPFMEFDPYFVGAAGRAKRKGTP